MLQNYQYMIQFTAIKSLFKKMHLPTALNLVLIEFANFCTGERFSAWSFVNWKTNYYFKSKELNSTGLISQRKKIINWKINSITKEEKKKNIINFTEQICLWTLVIRFHATLLCFWGKKQREKYTIFQI